jgi:hypothetical protein
MLALAVRIHDTACSCAFPERFFHIRRVLDALRGWC